MTYDELVKISHKEPILMYDGVCNLCDAFVKFVIKQDNKGVIKFCALQNQSGQSAREELTHGTDINTAIGLYNGKTYTHSDALYMVIKVLKGRWSLLLPFYILPKSFRDIVYNWVATNRYRWFGKADQCMMPTPDIRARFID